MKKEFLKMAGVKDEKDFYRLFPTEEAFFGMYPEAKKLVRKANGGLVRAQEGKENKGYSDEQLLEMLNNFQQAMKIPVFGKPSVFNLNGENNHHGQVTNIFYRQEPFDDFLKRKQLEKKSNFRNGGPVLPKAQGGGGKSMTCTSSGCRINDENAWVNNDWKNFVSTEKPPPPATEWENLTSYLTEDERKTMSEDDQAAMAMHRRFQHMKNPKNQLVTSQGAYAGYPGAAQTFFEKMNALPQNIYSGDPSAPSFREWLRQQSVNEEDKPIGNLKDIINKDYYSNFTVPTQAPPYFKRGGLVKYQNKGEVVDIPVDPNDVELLKNQRQNIINYFTGRMNFENPNNPERAAQIRKDAEQILNAIKETPENYENLIQYRTPRWFAESGVAGRYEPNKKDPSKDVIALYDPRVKTTDDYIKYYYPDDQRAIKYVNENRPMYDMFIKQGSEIYPRKHEGIHREFQRSLIPVLNREDNANLIYKSLVGPKTFEGLVTKRDSFLNPAEMQGKVVPLTRQQRAGIRDKYGWMAGEAQRLNIGNRGPASESLPISNTIPFSVGKMQPQEWGQARQQLYEQFNIDPSKPITADQLRSMDEQSYNLYKSNAPESSSSANPETYHINEHIQDFFDVHGKDYEKMAELLNSVVKNKPQNTSQFARYGGGTSNKNFEKSQKFNNLLMSGVRKPNLFKAQFGYGMTSFLPPITFMGTKKRAGVLADQIEKNKVLGNPVTSIVDPSGITNLPYLRNAYRDLLNSEGLGDAALNTIGYLFEGLATMPMIGKAVAPIKAIKTLSRFPKLEKTLVKGKNFLTKYFQPIAKIDSKLYPYLYRANPGTFYNNWITGSGRAARFFKGAGLLSDGVKELGNYIDKQGNARNVDVYTDPQKSDTTVVNVSQPVDETFVKIKLPDGSYRYLSTNSEEFAKLYNDIDPDSYNNTDSSFSLKKNKLN